MLARPVGETDPTKLMIAGTATHVITTTVLLNVRVTLGAVLCVRQDPLHGAGFFFGLIHQSRCGVRVAVPLVLLADSGPVGLLLAGEAEHVSATTAHHARVDIGGSDSVLTATPSRTPAHGGVLVHVGIGHKGHIAGVESRVDERGQCGRV